MCVVEIILQTSASSTENVPDADFFTAILASPTLQAQFAASLKEFWTPLTVTEIILRITDSAESSLLNEAYRGKTGPTNILSFFLGSLLPDERDRYLLGDLILCQPIVEEESRLQKKALLAHYAHLTLHGILHLLGFDHQTPQDEQRMESLEIKVLGELGYNDPYQ